MRHGEVRVAGVRSPTLEAGPEGAREAAVFVHGNPGSTGDWADLVARTGEHGRAVALDMPGFGRADKPDGFDHTMQGYARHLAGALDELGVERAHLVLHDFGGPWGLQWAADHPDAFASVTLVNTGVLLGFRWHVLARIWRTPLLGELFMRTTTRAGMRLMLRRGQPVPLTRERVDAMYAAAADRGTQRAVLRLYRATPADAMGALQPRLRPLDRPALVVWGVADPYIDVAQAERQRETFPGARVERLEGSGHWPMFDQPERLAALVVPFLAGQLRGFRPLGEHPQGNLAV
jgi:pimeloyl-ACP methyl ester carboxylesterase